jgi:hypothetical protein
MNLGVNIEFKILDSTNLEIFLEGLYEDVILIAVTFDEASTK